MTTSRSLEQRLERLLAYGTVVCSAVIIVGVILNELTDSPIIDFVTVGIVGFVTLPAARIVVMLTHYLATKDIPMVRITGIVLTLVMTGLILGVALN